MRLLALASISFLAACARNECPPAATATAPAPMSSACDVGPRGPVSVEDQQALIDPTDTTDPVIDLDRTNSPEQIALIKEALEADMRGDFQTCIAKNRAALQIDDNGRTQLHLSSCEQKAGKVIDALRDAQKALETAVRRRDAPVMKIARIRLRTLIREVPHVHFVEAEGSEVMRLTFDERPVPSDARAKKFSVDPGEHRVRIEGKRAGQLFDRQCTFTIAAGENVPIKLP